MQNRRVIAFMHNVYEELPASIDDLVGANICFYIVHSESPVKLHLSRSNPQLTSAKLHIQYSYSLNKVPEDLL